MVNGEETYTMLSIRRFKAHEKTTFLATTMRSSQRLEMRRSLGQQQAVAAADETFSAAHDAVGLVPEKKEMANKGRVMSHPDSVLRESRMKELIAARLQERQKQDDRVKTAEATTPLHPWVQGYTQENYLYYYNTETGESSWEYPFATDDIAGAHRLGAFHKSTAPFRSRLALQ